MTVDHGSEVGTEQDKEVKRRRRNRVAMQHVLDDPVAAIDRG